MLSRRGNYGSLGKLEIMPVLNRKTIWKFESVFFNL